MLPTISTMERLKLMDEHTKLMYGLRNDSGGNFFHEMCISRTYGNLLKAQDECENYGELLRIYDYDGNQCIHLAVIMSINYEFEGIQTLSLLLEMGADINGRDRISGSTPLHIMVRKNFCIMAKWLCQQIGLNFGVTDYQGFTPYQLAQLYGNHRMISIISYYQERLCY